MRGTSHLPALSAKRKTAIGSTRIVKSAAPNARNGGMVVNNTADRAEGAATSLGPSHKLTAVLESELDDAP